MFKATTIGGYQSFIATSHFVNFARYLCALDRFVWGVPNRFLGCGNPALQR